MSQEMKSKHGWTTKRYGSKKLVLVTTVWKPIQGKNDITLGFFGFFLQFGQFHMYTIQKQSRGKSFLEHFLRNSQNQKKTRPSFDADSTGVCWLNFSFHIVYLGKIRFHLKGRTLYFCKEFKFSFFESPIQKSNSGSKNENFISVLNHIVACFA